MPSNKRQAIRLLSLRLTAEEVAAVERAAAGRGIGLSTFARLGTLRLAELPMPCPRSHPTRKHNPAAAAAFARLEGRVGQVRGMLKVLSLQARDGRVDGGSTLAEAVVALLTVRDELAALAATGDAAAP